MLFNTEKNKIYKICTESQVQKIIDSSGDENICEDYYGSVDRYAEIISRFKGRKKILDVGSGTGVLPFLLNRLGHEVYGVDIKFNNNFLYRFYNINHFECNIELEDLPFQAEYFDGIVCSQVFEHLTFSHLDTMSRILKVLCKNGLLSIDVPNIHSFRNRSRMLRGKQILWDYNKHYLKPVLLLYKGAKLPPDRHNHEFTKDELQTLMDSFGLKNVETYYLRDERFRIGFNKIISIGSFFRNSIFLNSRKSIISFGLKP